MCIQPIFPSHLPKSCQIPWTFWNCWCKTFHKSDGLLTQQPASEHFKIHCCMQQTKFQSTCYLSD